MSPETNIARPRPVKPGIRPIVSRLCASCFVLRASYMGAFSTMPKQGSSKQIVRTRPAVTDDWPISVNLLGSGSTGTTAASRVAHTDRLSVFYFQVSRNRRHLQLWLQLCPPPRHRGRRHSERLYEREQDWRKKQIGRERCSAVRRGRLR